MIRILKHGKSEAEKFAADREVRQTVEAILDDIMARVTSPCASCRSNSINGIPRIFVCRAHRSIR
jgi:hypothetical protein